MKKWMLVIAAVAAVGLVAFTGVSSARAQAEPPQPPKGAGPNGMGPGRMNDGGLGLMHDTLVKAVASDLGMSVDDLESRLAVGETLAAIANSEGMDLESFQALMAKVRAQVLDDAVARGSITSDQSSWMQQRTARNRQSAGECPMWGEGTPPSDGSGRFGGGFGPGPRQ
jgi:hypothetical protein